MSGHSKWSTIRRQKEATDKKRGQIFSKLARAISIAARQGTDPEANFKLRLAIEKAKEANMPKENIKRAIERGGGGRGEEKLEEVVYEGYGPLGIAVIVEAVTDNKNRTTSGIKNIFERGGGKLAGPGAVGYQFKTAGLLTVEKAKDTEEQILTIIDLGANDVEEASDAVEVYVEARELEEMRRRLTKAGFKVLGAELIKRPLNEIEIKTPGEAEKALRFMENLEAHNDVQRVFANFDIKEEILNNLKNR